MVGALKHGRGLEREKRKQVPQRPGLNAHVPRVSGRAEIPSYGGLNNKHTEPEFP